MLQISDILGFHRRKSWLCSSLLNSLVFLIASGLGAEGAGAEGAGAEVSSFERIEADIVVYGGTSSGVIAAVQAKRMGKSVVVVGPDRHLGGLTSGGLGFTDTGNKAVIGGLARDFYHRIWQAYQEPKNWVWQKRDEYGNKGQGTPAIDGKNRTMWIFEPHIAEQVFEDYIRENQIPVYRDEWLNRESGVEKEGNRIKSITMLSGKEFVGKMFLDATYEGDLLAAAGVEFHVGREANSQYDEQWNGVQTGVLHHRHHFGVLNSKISPYKIPGDPDSGVLPRVSAEPPGEYGEADHRVQAYCYRYCATNHPANRMPFPKPAGYDPQQYELLLRVYESGWRETFGKFDPIPNRKTDTNNHGPFSTDNIGMNYDYPEATYERRQEILDEHRAYQQGWLYFVANDPRVPPEVRQKMQQWGLAKDEFIDNGNWPHQIYVREARRMVGKFVMTENELTKRKPTPEAVGMGSYTIDSHNVQRYITPEGFVQNEGDIGVKISPYTISYGALVPKNDQCENLLVSVCVSSSHIAFGSIRMEPVFMILGQSAATGACIAIDRSQAVQEVDYSELKTRLEADGQILNYESKTSQKSVTRKYINPKQLKGVVVDDDQAELVGDWKMSSASDGFVGFGYRHDDAQKNAKLSARFVASLPSQGTYEVLLNWPPNPNRSPRVHVEVTHAEGTQSFIVDQRKKPSENDGLYSLGKFEFEPSKAAVVTFSNPSGDGYAVIDCVQWIQQR